MKYDGGKNAVFHHIINQIPPHSVYVELFLGSGAVLRKKKPARLNYGVEIDPEQCSAVKPFLPTTAELINCDAITFLKGWRVPADEAVFIYADPPYLMETRTSQRDLYRYEFGSVEEHTELLKLLSSSGSRVAISGYRSDLYDTLLAGWRRVEFQAMKRNGEKATECLWCNYRYPVALHDYGYLGGNNTERQRIKRKKERWQNKLSKMSTLERMAVLAAIDQLQSELSSRPVS